MTIKTTRWYQELINQRESILQWVQAGSFVLSLVSVGLVLYYYGFPHAQAEQKVLQRSVLLLFAFYTLLFLLRALLALHLGVFLRENWKESLLVFIITVDTVSLLLGGVPIILELIGHMLGLELVGLYLLVIQGYLVFFVVLDLAKVGDLISRINIRPATLLTGSFVLLVFTGTGILMMPEMTHRAGSMDFLPALFTATSASCVTGLVVVDTATYFTFGGQFVIMLLFQLGGLGIITFTVFFSLFLRSGIGLKSQLAMKELLNSQNLLSTKGTLRKVVSYTLAFELLGGFFLFMFSEPHLYASSEDQLFHTAFHAISAFCNAGFSLHSNGLMASGMGGNYMFHLVIGVLIFFGGLGFPVLEDLFGLQNLRTRMQYPWKTWQVSTRIAVFASLSLLALGTFVFFGLERELLAERSPTGQLITALFQSMTTRTAGFNTVDIGALRTPTLVFFLFLMFIGTSSASTGGGIKTSTFVVLFRAVFSVVQGKQNMNIGRRTISPDTLNKAYAVFLFATSFISLSTFILSITEEHLPLLDLVFEEVSAFCTVGLSTGITRELSTLGQLIIILNMFVGRVGIITLALALSTISNTEKFRYPRAQLIIG